MDDTRDIAIRGSESATAAHHRLDGINGQIRRLGDSHEKMRQDFADRNEKLVEDFATTTVSLVTDMATIRTTLSNALKVAAAIVSLGVAIAAGLTVYALTHMRTSTSLHTPSPPAAVIAHIASK